MPNNSSSSKTTAQVTGIPKPMGGNRRKQNAAHMKNYKALNDVIDGVSGVIGRVEKALGNSSFQIILANGSMTQGLIRGCLKGGKNSVAFVSAGAFVILAETDTEGGSRMKQHEILGVINDPKTFKMLKKSGRLPESLVSNTTADDLFDHSDEEEEDTSIKPLISGASHFQAKEGAFRSAVTERLDAMTEPSYDEFVTPLIKKARISAPSEVKPAGSHEVTEMTGLFGETRPGWTSAWKDDFAPTPKPIERGVAPECWEDDEVNVDAL